MLLGVLGLPIDHATRIFGQICERVFLADNCDIRASVLVDSMRTAMDELQLPYDTRLQGDLDLGSKCRVYVFSHRY